METFFYKSNDIEALAAQHLKQLHGSESVIVIRHTTFGFYSWYLLGNVLTKLAVG